MELVSKPMIEYNLFLDNDIEEYVQQCVKTNYLRLNKELTSEHYRKAIDEAKKDYKYILE